MQERFEAARDLLALRGQGHVLRWWDSLDEAGRGRLLDDVEQVSWDAVDGLIDSHVRNVPVPDEWREVGPPEVVSPGEGVHEIRDRGEALVREGQVAALTVAGGQGTRLGVDGPKGMVPVTPVGGRTLFGLFADMVWAARRRYSASIPWYVMTSPENHEATRAYFERCGYFDLPEGDVIFFSQGMLPVLDFSGRLLMAAKDRIAFAPDGHGGTLKALADGGHLADMRRRGVTTVSYFQVDNPLVRPMDPVFLGFHRTTGSEMSTKVSAKADDLERVGNVCMVDGRLRVIEYSELPEELARARNADGSRRLNWGNLAIHLFDVGFLDRVVRETFQLPYRRAEKAVAFVDESGERVVPDVPNAVKLETFVFDAMPLAENPLVMAVDRAEEFSPVKNATGVDSLETSQADQNARACRWLESAGVEVPRSADGSPAVLVHISPRFASSAEELRHRVDRVPRLEAGGEYCLEEATERKRKGSRDQGIEGSR